MNTTLDQQPAASARKLADILQKDAYLRQRLRPDLSDIEYLILEDLRDIVVHLCEGQKGRLLDYGCGGSPYRGLLPQFSPYIRADITPAEGIDLITNDQGLLPNEKSGSYDIVFSTQVLEHVPDTAQYLNEAYRLLRPGGSLILTTHGFYPEHGCPGDFYRWTGYGLKQVAENAGFVVEENYKITAGLRAAVYFLHVCIFFNLSATPGSGWNRFLRLVRRAYQLALIPPLNALGRLATHQCKVSNHLNTETLYVGVALRARKPEAT